MERDVFEEVDVEEDGISEGGKVEVRGVVGVVRSIDEGLALSLSLS